MKLRVTVIGCWSPYPAPGSACSAYLIESGNTALLLDCGHGAMGQLFSYISPEKLNGVVITHSHPDHYNDLPALRHYWRSQRFMGQDLEPLPVWFPPGDKETFRWQQVAELNLQTATGVIQVDDLTMEFTPGIHTLPVAMVKIQTDGKTLFYTGDTAYSQEGAAASRGSDLLIAECTLPPSEAHLAAQLGHLTWDECGRWAREAGCSRLLATHFWPEYNLEEVRDVAAREYQGDLLMAQTGLVVEV